METPKQKSGFRSPRGVKRPAIKTRTEEAYEILQETVKSRSLRDASTIYGEHIATKHRSYSQHTKNVIEHLIGNILFRADMGQYERHVSPCPQQTAASQATHTFIPSQTPIPSPSPTDSLYTHYDQHSSSSQSTYSAVPSPSSNSSSTYDQHTSVHQQSQSYTAIPPSLSQILISTKPDEPEASLIHYINTFKE